jgi:hypothetical protein
MENTPAAPHSGEKVSLRFLLFHPKTGAQIKEFNVVHTKLFHLFIVSHDLQHYAHIHPIQQPDGSFTIETVLPEPGQYEIFCDVFPVDGTPRVLHRSLSTADSPDADHAMQPRLDAGQSLTKTVAGIRFALTLQPPQPVAGRPTLLQYSVVNDETGEPITDLQPYLGAWGHAISLREDATGFLHSHATRLFSGGPDRSRLPGDPQLAFSAVFARPGLHRVWSQIQHKNEVVTVSFDVSVLQLDQLAKWDGTVWSSLGGGPIHGLDGTVRALAAIGSDIYLGGDFTRVDGVEASRIAKWDGHGWSALGGGVNGTVWAIAVRGGDVYAGGEFTTAGDTEARGIARWDGRKWSALGSGIGGDRNAPDAPTVYSIAVRGSEVYAGGRFAEAGGAAANGIAMWDGRTWAPLGDGVRTGIYDGVVRALALRGRDLYAGGQFISAGGADAYNIARWNGRRWSALGSGMRGNLEQVLALGVSGSDVFAGGMFMTAGGVNAPNIAKWHGTGWSAVDVRPYGGVWTIAVSGRSLYAGGASFDLPGGAVARGIVEWDGGKWSGLGSGVGTSVYGGPIMAIAPSGGKLYIGGDAFSLPDAPDLTPRRAARNAR